MAADEAIGGLAEGKSEAEEVVGKATGRGVEDVGEHNVHGVFGANRASTKHGKAELHGEDKIGREEKVSAVDGITSVG